LKHHTLICFVLIVGIACGAFVAVQTDAAGALSPKEARCLIARMLGIQLTSDEVRFKDISSLRIFYTLVRKGVMAFRFVKRAKDKWRIAEIRTGDRRWEDVEMLLHALNVEKTQRARAELESIAMALELYRREHGSYVEAKTEATLVDTLNPRYLKSIVRIDP